MNSFDKIIGYNSIKDELLEICDMIHNKDIYDSIGAKLPQGLLLYGDPGLGKTLMSKSFINECGLPAYTVRRNKDDKEFIEAITETFLKAKENAPSIIFLDDMDKFSNEDRYHRNTEEYVAIQSGIDEIKGSDVFVIATANDIDNLPDSLIRTGRFDIKILVKAPTGKDAEKIIGHYLKDKKIASDVNMEDLANMMSYSSCSDLETILNDAAIKAAHERCKEISMRHMVKSVLRMQYDSPDNLTELKPEVIEKTALHEAGHLVVSEVLTPGSVGLVSIRSTGRDSIGGFTHKCKSSKNRICDIMIGLAGKAAVEMYYAENAASGCQTDIESSVELLRENILEDASLGLGMFNIETSHLDLTQSLLSRNEAVTYAELERYMMLTRNLLIKNREFLEKAKKELLEKETLLYSDIRRIRESCKVSDTNITA